MAHRWIYSFLVAFTLAVACATTATASTQDAEELAPGKWTLSTDGENFTLAANQVDIDVLLAAIRSMSSGDIRIQKTTEQKITARFYNVSLDQLLTRLGLEYFLIYGRSGSGDNYELESGWMSNEDHPKAAPAPTVVVTTGTVIAAVSTNSFSNDIRQKLGVGNNGLSTDTVGDVYKMAYPVAISLDGNIGDWPDGLPWQKVAHDMGFNGATNDSDASFDVAVVADTSNLYIAVKITDDLKAINETKSLSTQKDDSFEMILDHRGANLAATDLADVTFRMNRHQVMMNTESGVAHIAPKQFVSQSSGAHAVIVDGPTGWNIEIVVPFTAFGYDPAKKEPVGLNMIFRDHDTGNAQEKKLVWSSAQRASGDIDADHSKLGSLQLIDIR